MSYTSSRMGGILLLMLTPLLVISSYTIQFGEQSEKHEGIQSPIIDCRGCQGFFGQEILGMYTRAHAVQLLGTDIYVGVGDEYFVLFESAFSLAPDWDFPVVVGMLSGPMGKNTREDQEETDNHNKRNLHWTWTRSAKAGQKAVDHCQDDCSYRLLSNTAFVYYHYLGDAKKASDLYARAALKPNAPSGAGRMASLVLSDLGEKEKALAMRELIAQDETLPESEREWARGKVREGG